MGYTATLQRTLVVDGVSRVGNTQFDTDGKQECKVSIAKGATNEQVNILATITSVKVLWLLSTVALTVKTNSSSAPNETINLAAGEPYVMVNGQTDHSSGAVTHDLTKVYVTEGNVAAGELEIIVLNDVTP